MSTTEMQAMMEAATPGTEHKKLDTFAGTWTAEVSHWMDPGGEPSKSTGIMKNHWVLGDRFLKQDYKSDSTEMPFEGTGYFGYNNITGKYEGFWIDTMSTCMSTECGSCEGSTWTMTGEGEWPVAGNVIRKRSVVTVQNKNNHTMEMFMTGPDGNETKVMEIKYRRDQG